MKKMVAIILAVAMCVSMWILPVAAQEQDILDVKFQEVLGSLDFGYSTYGSLAAYMVVKTNQTVFEDLYEKPWEHMEETLVFQAKDYEEVLNRNFVPTAQDLEYIRNEGYGGCVVYNAADNTYTVKYPGGFGGALAAREYLGYVATSQGFDVYYGKANYCFLADVLPEGVTESQYAGLLNNPAVIEFEGKQYQNGPDGYYYLDSVGKSGMKYSVVLDSENVRISGAVEFTEAECPESFEKMPEVDDDLLAIMDDIQELVEKYGPEIPDEVKNGTDKGTTGVYEPDGSSYYVAIGDDTAIGENSYVSLLATRYGVTAKNLAAKNMLIDEADAAFLAENNADIVKADLITIGFSVNGFASVAVEEVMKDLSDAESYLQWDKYLPEEGVKEIEAVLARMKKYLEDNGMSGNLMGISKSDALVAAAESIAFGTLAYINELPRLIDDLRVINPTAQIVVVGMDNPMENSSIALGSGEKMELGIYVDQLLKNMDDASQTVVLERENAVFVTATHAANENDNQELTENKLIRSYIGGVRAEAKPNEEGQKYIQNRINLALRQNGDVDGDGKISYNDALIVLRLSIGLAELSEEEAAFGDVDGADGLSYNDALKILRASIGIETLG